MEELWFRAVKALRTNNTAGRWPGRVGQNLMEGSMIHVLS